ncbi:MAG: magnesium-protoporphyrin IX monomethyl ester (oxidative) cyclase [Pseudomonadota bacterium]
MTAKASVNINDVTVIANTETVLTPRFYRTDMDALERIDLEPVRREWDEMMREFDTDGNVDHFVRDATFADEIQELDPELYEEFLDFLVTSVTSEYSGCVLYADIEKTVTHPEIKKLMGYMRRDEARHAGFINRSLKDFGKPVDLGFLKREKKATYFRPKFIYYATYLSEKIGYARYITIFRHLQKHPERRFHPIFRWFEQWCNDEFRHGEAFALIMRADPKLLSGVNKLWIRFFLIAVYATMYVRDHTRPKLYEALGIDPTEYDFQVFHITSAISRQVFPFTLRVDDPRFRRGLEDLRDTMTRMDELAHSRGIAASVRRLGLRLRAARCFASLFLVPVETHDMPANVRMAPAW